ncbi:hypothetical protein [Arthrobacter sp. SO3]|uniref:hypothetical protein n=1 Tax=Arthrobacter sp. SO3 TaxID=1897057 RepID=UPI001D0011B5|nr:hypothetical protein [Arthrobacter sp. SO3]
MTTASTAVQPRTASHRREVTTMKQKLHRLLRLQSAPRHTTLFNGQLLDQKREDVHLVMYRIGLIR